MRNCVLHSAIPNTHQIPNTIVGIVALALASEPQNGLKPPFMFHTTVVLGDCAALCDENTEGLSVMHTSRVSALGRCGDTTLTCSFLS